MPPLLRSLRVESFSTHSLIDPDEQAILAADLPAFTTQTTRLVEAMGAHLGVVFDRSAERIVLIDELRARDPADTALHLLIGLVAKHHAGAGRIVIPANVSRVAERIAGAYGVPVERAGITQAGLIEAAAARRRHVRGRARRRLHVPGLPAGLRRGDERRRRCWSCWRWSTSRCRSCAPRCRCRR